MVRNDDGTPPERKARYVWDPKTLTWVETAEPPAEEAEAEAVAADTSPAEETIEEIATAKSIVAEAQVLPEEVQYKGVLIRFGGVIIDIIALLIIGILIRYTVGQVVTIPDYSLPIFGLVYFGGFWWWRGQTPGKMIIGARVVRTNGARVDVVRALLRGVFYLIPLYGPIVYFANSISPWFTFVLPIIPLVVMGLNRQKRGIHDLIAGTCVINTRVRAPQVEEEVEAAEAEQSETSETETSEQR